MARLAQVPCPQPQLSPPAEDSCGTPLPLLSIFKIAFVFPGQLIWILCILQILILLHLSCQYLKMYLLPFDIVL